MNRVETTRTRWGQQKIAQGMLKERWPTYTYGNIVGAWLNADRITGTEPCAQKLGAAVCRSWRPGQRSESARICGHAFLTEKPHTTTADEAQDCTY